MIVRFIYIGGIDNYHCLSLIYVMMVDVTVDHYLRCL